MPISPHIMESLKRQFIKIFYAHENASVSELICTLSCAVHLLDAILAYGVSRAKIDFSPKECRQVCYPYDANSMQRYGNRIRNHIDPTGELTTIVKRYEEVYEEVYDMAMHGHKLLYAKQKVLIESIGLIDVERLRRLANIAKNLVNEVLLFVDKNERSG